MPYYIDGLCWKSKNKDDLPFKTETTKNQNGGKRIPDKVLFTQKTRVALILK